MTTPPCRQCHAGIHSKCEGDFNDHCGCRACYRHDKGPFHRPPDGTPWDVVGESEIASVQASTDVESDIDPPLAAVIFRQLRDSREEEP